MQGPDSHQPAPGSAESSGAITAPRRSRQLLPASQLAPSHPSGQSEQAAAAVRRSRTRSPVPRHSEVQPDGADLRKLVAEELDTFASAEVLKAIHKVLTNLSKRINTLQKLNERIAGTKEDIAALDNNRVPRGCKPFSIPYQALALEHELSPDQAGIAGVPFKPGVTVSEAKRTAYLQHLAAQKRLDMVVFSEQRQELREQAKRSVFVIECNQCMMEKANTWKDLDLDLEWEDATVPAEYGEPAQEAIEAKFIALYIKCVERAARMKNSENNQIEIEKKKKEEAVADMVSKKPAELLAMAIRTEVAKQKKQGKKEIGADPVTALYTASVGMYGVDDMNATASAVVENQFSKNEVSPVKSGGKQQTKGQKGKGKGKGKESGKLPQGKGPSNASVGKKGDGKSNVKGKSGKGKGKGKGGKGKNGKNNKKAGKGKNKGKEWRGKDSWSGSAGR